MADPGEVLRRHGLRMTEQRRRVLAVLDERSHLTPEDIVAAVGDDGGPQLPPSTIYRTLDALQDVGLVDHTHLDHRAPTYQRAGHHGHLHLVCRRCGEVLEADASLAEEITDRLRSVAGFVADPTHMAIHGHCARCVDAAAEEGGA